MKNKMLSQSVADSILSMITIEKRFSVGDKLPNEIELSEELNVSRTTLREAIRILVAYNILEIRRGKGTYVTEKVLEQPQDLEQLSTVKVNAKDLYEMRLIFEPEAAYLAAVRGTDAEIKRIIDYGKRIEDEMKNGIVTKVDELTPLRAPVDDKTPGTPESTTVKKLSNIQIDNTGKISATIDMEETKTVNNPNFDNTKPVGPDNPQTIDKTVTVTKTVYLGAVAIATFQNPNGLTKVGNNYYTTSDGDNTGDMATAVPGTGSTSTLMPGYIEASNVDLAKEFADMITTHRGFQANSKMITVSDEMLSDLVAMKR